MAKNKCIGCGTSLWTGENYGICKGCLLDIERWRKEERIKGG